MSCKRHLEKLNSAEKRNTIYINPTLAKNQ